MTDIVLQFDGVTKSYGREQSLIDLTLSLEAGTRLALLGHNGAGKTTLIKAALGLTGIDKGRIAVFGDSPGAAAARPLTGYLPESARFHNALTGREQLSFFARLKGHSTGIVPELMDRVGLAEQMGKRIGGYSKGMRQRLGLAQLLIGEPRLIVLDEPTSGLDPLSRRLFYQLIGELAERGTAVLMASHELTEIQAHTDRIALMRKGQLVADATITQLREHASLPIRLQVTPKPGQVELTAEKLNGRRINGHAVEVICDPRSKMARLTEITGLGNTVNNVDVLPPSLEDIYAHYCGESDKVGGQSK